MDGTCGTHRKRESHTGLWVEKVKKLRRLEDLDVNVRIILKCVIQK